MRKHSFDPASFVLGLVITGVAVAYLVAEAQDRTVEGAWVLPLTLIGLGVAAVAAGLNRALRRPPQPVGAELGLGDRRWRPSPSPGPRTTTRSSERHCCSGARYARNPS